MQTIPSCFPIPKPRRQPITPKQRGYLVGLYKQRGIFRNLPEWSDDAAREISQLISAKKS